MSSFRTLRTIRLPTRITPTTTATTALRVHCRPFFSTPITREDANETASGAAANAASTVKSTAKQVDQTLSQAAVRGIEKGGMSTLLFLLCH